jgi:signal transduction histidine kinase
VCSYSDPGGGPAVFAAGAVLAYRVRRAGPDSTAVAAYALTSCFSDRDGPVLDGALAAGPLLPPTLVGEVEADSLLSVRVTHPITGVLYRSSREYESAYVGTALLSDPGVGGGARLDVTLRPAVADRLLRENVGPYSRAPLALGLLVATVALILVATVLLVRAVRLARLRERFVADVSHELRTPLQQVLLFAQLLRIGQERSAEERVRFLSIIEREALRLIALVERVLEFARPNGIGDRADDEDRADVAAVVRAAVDAIGPLLAERSARVTLDLPDTAVARASSDAVHQIVLNLLDNALKYGPAGQSIGIRVATGRDVRLEVADDGPGVPAADRSLVWEPFYRLEREESAARAGSGIGLAVVRELAERFGALTEVEDAPGGGALFRVRFQPAVAS